MKASRVMRTGVLRRSRALIASKNLWRTRLVFWAGALATGLVSVFFAVAADEAQHLFTAVTSGPPWRSWLPLAMTPLGMMLCAWIAHVWFPGSQGSGIPQAMAGRHFREPKDRRLLLSLRLVLGKIGLTVLGLGFGASIGREGPTVQIGASIMLLSARLGGMARAKGLILAGSAAGIAAAFNTPLAGIVFAIEEMSRSNMPRTNGVILSAVVIAGAASVLLLGPYTYFGEAEVTAELPGDWKIILGSGLMGGLLGAGFSKAVLGLTRRIRRFWQNRRLARVLLVSGISGLIVAVVGILSGGMTYGTSYEFARAAVEGKALPHDFFFMKLIATLASTVSGIPGGLFAPSLAVGAGLGSFLGDLLGSDIGLAAILGMAGYFAGVVQAPLTAFVIVFEMTGNHGNVIPIMASSMLGYGVSRLILAESLYGALARLWIADILRQTRAIEQESQRANDGDTKPAAQP
jgi:H+/Cl- antiporter ClcA